MHSCRYAGDCDHTRYADIRYADCDHIRYADLQICRFADMQICQYEDMQVLKELRLTLRHGTCNVMKIEIEQKCRLEKKSRL